MQGEFLLTQQFKEQVVRLTQAAQARRADLEKSAFQAELDYRQKKLADSYVEQQGNIQQESELRGFISRYFVIPIGACRKLRTVTNN